jgi:putative restriction endonuclease
MWLFAPNVVSWYVKSACKTSTTWTLSDELCQHVVRHMGTTPDSQITNIEQAIERLYDLNVGTIGSGPDRHERPHKPILILTVLDLLSMGKVTASRILWSQDLRNRFTEYFDEVHRLNDSNTPENPFLYLRGDGFWQPQLVIDGTERPLEHTPTVADADAERVFARLLNGLEEYVREPAQRVRLREAVVSRYFPTQRSQLEPLFCEKKDGPAKKQKDTDEDEETEESAGRNPAFRRKVLEVYDSQCAACGLRIKLPDKDLTFVDGAHLIPFTLSRNDHPTNGIALCKNHHWAMDRFLIAPTPEGRWKSSTRLDVRRSPGERDLCQLDDQPILPPHDDAFRPALDGLRWRTERLLKLDTRD